MTHISVLSTDEKFIREEYTKELPCWTSDKYKIYFYKYDEDPRRKYYPDGFIVKPL